MVEIKIESPWKEKFFVVSRILGCVLLIMTIIFYIHRDFCDIVNFYFGLVVADEEFWDMLTAIFTGVAAICAFFAYMQSIRIREHSSFDAVFTQLLGSLQSFINNKSLQETKFKQNWWMSQLLFLQYLVIYNRHYDVFLNFCNIYKSYSKSKAFSKLDENEIRQLWNSFSDALIYKSKFFNCFKYLYHIINLVIKSPLDEKQKEKYIGIIQAQLNLDILFCYLINQIATTQGFNSTYCTRLKKYRFFKNLFEDYDGYGKLAKETIPAYIIECFTDKK